MAGPFGFPVGDCYVSDDYWGHRNRNPPSTEPGTDYACASGTDLKAPYAGRIQGIKTTTSGATGRVIYLACDDGSYVRMIHLSQIWVSQGQRVTRGQVIGKSGASANGSEWGVGAHCHTSLWAAPNGYVPSPGSDMTDDFETYLGTTPTPEPEPEPEPIEDEETMPKNSGFTFVRSSDGKTVRQVNNLGSGIWVEWSDSSIKNADIMSAFDIPSLAPVTEGFRNAMVSKLDKIAAGPASSGTLSSTRSIIAGAVVLGALALAAIAIVLIVTLT